MALVVKEVYVTHPYRIDQTSGTNAKAQKWIDVILSNGADWAHWA
jgi:hypothetical protein